MSTSTHQPPPSSSHQQQKGRGRGMQIQVPATPLTHSTRRPNVPSSAQSRTSHYSSTTLPHRNTNTNTSKDLFHHRQASAADVPLPSHRPPTTFHSLQVDLKAQDVFREYLKKRNPKIRILYPGEDAFEMNRQDMVRILPQ